MIFFLFSLVFTCYLLDLFIVVVSVHTIYDTLYFSMIFFQSAQFPHFDKLYIGMQYCIAAEYY